MKNAKKVVGLAIAAAAVLSIGVTVFAWADDVTSKYYWKVVRQNNYCSTEYTSIEGTGSTKRTFQTQAKSSSSSDGVCTTLKDSQDRSGLGKRTRSRDNSKTAATTYHNVSLNDGNGWHGGYTYVSGKGAVNLETPVTK